MILLCGIPTEPPLARVAAALDDLGVPVLMFNQRAVREAECSFEVDATGLRGTLRTNGTTHRLEDFAGAYTRLMDERLLPELRGEPLDAPAREACRKLHDTLYRWMEITPARVINRAGPMASNNSKPYQAQLIMAAGLRVPETLVTNDPELVGAFIADHGRVVYKSISGARSIVQELGRADIARLENIRWCPVQFQAYVDGVDVRVHVVGERVFATRVTSAAIDYRYAGVGGGQPARLEPARLSDALEESCVALTCGLGLRFSGIDLRMAEDGDVVCFEVNPCPAFAYYEAHTGQPIADAVARHLAGASA